MPVILQILDIELTYHSVTPFSNSDILNQDREWHWALSTLCSIFQDFYWFSNSNIPFGSTEYSNVSQGHTPPRPYPPAVMTSNVVLLKFWPGVNRVINMDPNIDSQCLWLCQCVTFSCCENLDNKDPYKMEFESLCSKDLIKQF